jgi:hypothetical protein
LRGGGHLPGEAVGGEVDALEESVGAFRRQGAGGDGLDDAVERAQDGGAIGKGAETDGVPHQRALAAPFTQVKVPVIVAAVLARGDERTTRVSIGLAGEAKFIFHRFSSIIKKT